MKIKTMPWFNKHALNIIWALALAAMLGSLYFQYALGFPPCVLCWYQRIAIYPLVVIIPIGLLKKDGLLPLYTLALGLIGLAISVYHNLLYYNIIPESLAPCVQGVSCTTRYIHWLGFIDIPQLSLVSLVVIVAVSFMAWKNSKQTI